MNGMNCELENSNFITNRLNYLS